MSPALNLKAVSVACQRRRHQRYPIGSGAQVVISGRRQEAATVDISTGGILLKSSDLFPVGRRVLLFIDWPSLHGESHALRLVVDGKVARSNQAGTGIQIVRYNFSTRRQPSVQSTANVPVDVRAGRRLRAADSK